MAEFQVSSCAYVKMLLHAAKYPHNAVNGVLLAEKDRPDGKMWKVVDAIPLFHISLYLSPMAEIALVHVDELASARNLKVVGYYCAHENLNNNGIDGVPGVRVAEKIAEHFPSACLLVVGSITYPFISLFLMSFHPFADQQRIGLQVGGQTRNQYVATHRRSMG